MNDNETYNGWTNRETWAVALHINNDQGWQESVLETLREARTEDNVPLSIAYQAQDVRHEAIGRAAELISDNVDSMLDLLWFDTSDDYRSESKYSLVREDIGSLWRVNWHELGASFLEDLEDN